MRNHAKSALSTMLVLYTQMVYQDGRNPVHQLEGQEVRAVVKSTGSRGLKSSLEGVMLKAHR